MRILIISDTHGDDSAFIKIKKSELRFDVLIHAGDMDGSESFYESYFRGVRHMVSGNCDYGGRFPYEDVFMIDCYRVFLTHRHRQHIAQFDRASDVLVEEAKQNDAQILIYGHTHYPVYETRNGVICINPGSTYRPRQPDHRPTYGVLTIDDHDHTLNYQLKYC